MAFFAELDKNNIVTKVLVTDSELPNQGLDWLLKTFGGTWVQTDYNTAAGVQTLGGQPLRKNFAGIGFSYDDALDAFIPPKPFESWVLDEATCNWVSPTPYPTDGKDYQWKESITSWVETPQENTGV